MNRRGGRIALVVVGVIALLIGAVFALQGLNVLPGSVMSGSRMWLIIGLILAVVGIVLVAIGLRRRGAGGTSK